MISERATNTNLFRKRKELEISYAWEKREHVVFEKCESDDIINDYFLIENSDGGISVTDSKETNSTRPIEY